MWRPRAKSLALLDQVNAVLREYIEHLPLTIRQIFYRLVGAYAYDKTEQAYDRLGEMLNRARRAGFVRFGAITPSEPRDTTRFISGQAYRAVSRGLSLW